MRPVLTIALLMSLSIGCVRIRDDIGEAQVKVSTAVVNIDRNHRRRMADFYNRMANDPPKTVSEWAEASVKVGEASEKIRKEEFAKLLEPLLSSRGESDELDPAKAKRVFSEIAKGLRR